MSNVGAGASAVDHLTAFDHATGFDRTAAGLLEPSATHFGAGHISATHIGSFDTTGVNVGSATSHLGGASPHGGRVDLTGSATGLHTAISDSMSGIRGAAGHAADFHALGISELKSIVDGDVNVVRMTPDGITMHVGAQAGEPTALHMNFQTMSLTNGAGHQVVVAPEAHAVLGTSDAKAASGQTLTSAPPPTAVRDATPTPTPSSSASASATPSTVTPHVTSNATTTAPAHGADELSGTAGTFTGGADLAEHGGALGGDAGRFAEGPGAHSTSVRGDQFGVSAHDRLDLAGRRDGTGDTAGSAAPAVREPGGAAEAVAVAVTPDHVALRPGPRPQAHPGASGAARPPRSRFEAVTGGVGGRIGAERLSAWNKYEMATSEATRAESALHDLGGGMEKPSETVDQAAAKLDAHQAGLGVDAARQDLARLHMDVDAIRARLDGLATPKTKPGSGLASSAGHDGDAAHAATSGEQASLDKLAKLSAPTGTGERSLTGTPLSTAGHDGDATGSLGADERVRFDTLGKLSAPTHTPERSLIETAPSAPTDAPAAGISRVADWYVDRLDGIAKDAGMSRADRSPHTEGIDEAARAGDWTGVTRRYAEFRDRVEIATLNQRFDAFEAHLDQGFDRLGELGVARHDWQLKVDAVHDARRTGDMDLQNAALRDYTAFVERHVPAEVLTGKDAPRAFDTELRRVLGDLNSAKGPGDYVRLREELGGLLADNALRDRLDALGSHLGDEEAALSGRVAAAGSPEEGDKALRALHDFREQRDLADRLDRLRSDRVGTSDTARISDASDHAGTPSPGLHERLDALHGAPDAHETELRRLVDDAPTEADAGHALENLHAYREEKALQERLDALRGSGPGDDHLGGGSFEPVHTDERELAARLDGLRAPGTDPDHVGGPADGAHAADADDLAARLDALHRDGGDLRVAELHQQAREAGTVEELAAVHQQLDAHLNHQEQLRLERVRDYRERIDTLREERTGHLLTGRFDAADRVRVELDGLERELDASLSTAEKKASLVAELGKGVDRPEAAGHLDRIVDRGLEVTTAAHAGGTGQSSHTFEELERFFDSLPDMGAHPLPHFRDDDPPLPGDIGPGRGGDEAGDLTLPDSPHTPPGRAEATAGDRSGAQTPPPRISEPGSHELRLEAPKERPAPTAPAATFDVAAHPVPTALDRDELLAARAGDEHLPEGGSGHSSVHDVPSETVSTHPEVHGGSPSVVIHDGAAPGRAAVDRDPRWGELRAGATPAPREHRWVDPVSHPMGPGAHAPRYEVHSAFDVRRFEVGGAMVTDLTVRVDLVGAAGVTSHEVDTVWDRAAAGIDRVFNAPGHRLAGGDLLHVTLERADTVAAADGAKLSDAGDLNRGVGAGAHVRVTVGGPRTPMNQHHWSVDATDQDLAHELGHQLGLRDEYRDPTAPHRPEIDGSLMGDYHLPAPDGLAQGGLRGRYLDLLHTHIGEAGHAVPVHGAGGRAADEVPGIAPHTRHDAHVSGTGLTGTAVSPRAPRPQTDSAVAVGGFTAAPKEFLAEHQILLRMDEGMRARTPGADLDYGAFLRWVDRQDRHWFSLTRTAEEAGAGEHAAFVLTPAVEKYAHEFAHDTELRGILGDRELPAVGADEEYIAAHYVPYFQGKTANPEATVGHRVIPFGRGGDFNPDFVFTGAMNGCAFTVTAGRDADGFTAWHYQSPTSNLADAERFRLERRPTDWFGDGEYQSPDPGAIPETTNIMWRGDNGWEFLSQENHSGLHNAAETSLHRFQHRPVRFTPGHEWSFTTGIHLRNAEERLARLERFELEKADTMRADKGGLHLQLAFYAAKLQAEQDVAVLRGVTGAADLARRVDGLGKHHELTGAVIAEHLTRHDAAQLAEEKALWSWQKLPGDVLWQRGQIQNLLSGLDPSRWLGALTREAKAFEGPPPAAASGAATHSEGVSPRAPTAGTTAAAEPVRLRWAPPVKTDSGTVEGEWKQHDGGEAAAGLSWSEWKGMEHRQRVLHDVTVDTDELAQADLHQFADLLTRGDKPDLAERILDRAARLDTAARTAGFPPATVHQVIWQGHEIVAFGSELRAKLGTLLGPRAAGHPLSPTEADELRAIRDRLDTALRGHVKDATPYGGLYTLRNDYGPLVGTADWLLENPGVLDRAADKAEHPVPALGLNADLKKLVTRRVQRYRSDNAYADVPTGSQWNLTEARRPGTLPKEERTDFVRDLSQQNITRLHDEIDPVLTRDERYRTLVDSLQSLPYRIKHSTPAYHAIANSGVLSSQGDLARRDAKFLASGKSSDANTSNLGNDDFAFFRVEANDKPMLTRYGPTTLVFDAKLLGRYDGWVSLHDQLEPLDRPAMRELRAPVQKLDAGSEGADGTAKAAEGGQAPQADGTAAAGDTVVRTTAYGKGVGDPGTKRHWVNTYPGRTGAAKKATVEFEQEVFFGDQFVEGLSLSVVREVLRIGGPFEEHALRLGAALADATDTAAADSARTALADLVSSLYRPEAKFGSGLPVDPRPMPPGVRPLGTTRFEPLTVHNPHGDGRYLPDGSLDPVAFTAARMADRAADAVREGDKALANGTTVDNGVTRVTNRGLKDAVRAYERAQGAARKAVERTEKFLEVSDGDRARLAEKLLDEHRGKLSDIDDKLARLRTNDPSAKSQKASGANGSQEAGPSTATVAGPKKLSAAALAKQAQKAEKQAKRLLNPEKAARAKLEAEKRARTEAEAETAPAADEPAQAAAPAQPAAVPPSAPQHMTRSASADAHAGPDGSPDRTSTEPPLGAADPRWRAARAAAEPVSREHRWVDPVSLPHGPGPRRTAPRYVVSSAFDARRFEARGETITDLTVRVHLTGGEGLSAGDLDALWRRTEDGVARVFNAPGHRLPGGDLLHVTVERAGSADHAHLAVNVQGPGTHSAQHTWSSRASSQELAHEIGHQLGLRDEYRDATAPQRPAVTGSLMGDFHRAAPAGLAHGGLRDRHLHLLRAVIGDLDHPAATRETAPAGAPGSLGADPRGPQPNGEPAPGTVAEGSRSLDRVRPAPPERAPEPLTVESLLPPPPARMTHTGQLSAADRILPSRHSAQTLTDDLVGGLAGVLGAGQRERLRAEWGPEVATEIWPALSAMTRGEVRTLTMDVGGWTGEVEVSAKVVGAGLVEHGATLDSLEFEDGSESFSRGGFQRERRSGVTAGLLVKGKAAEHTDLTGQLSGNWMWADSRRVASGGRMFSRTKTAEPALKVGAEIQLEFDFAKVRGRLGARFEPAGAGDGARGTRLRLPLRIPVASAAAESGALPDLAGQQHFRPPLRVEQTLALGGSDTVRDLFLVDARGERTAGRLSSALLGDPADPASLAAFGRLAFGADWKRIRKVVLSRLGSLDVLQFELKGLTAGEVLEIDLGGDAGTLLVTAEVASMTHRRNTGRTEFNTGSDITRVFAHGQSADRSVRAAVTAQSADLGAGPGSITGAVQGEYDREGLAVRQESVRTGTAVKTKVPGVVFDGVATLVFTHRRTVGTTLAPVTAPVTAPATTTGPVGASDAVGGGAPATADGAGRPVREARAKVGFQVLVDAAEARPVAAAAVFSAAERPAGPKRMAATPVEAGDIAWRPTDQVWAGLRRTRWSTTCSPVRNRRQADRPHSGSAPWWTASAAATSAPTGPNCARPRRTWRPVSNWLRRCPR